jgi:hypothetical protein
MFGSPVSFNIRGDDSYQTVIGCCWSFLVLSVLAASFFWYFYGFLDTTNVEVNTRQEMLDEYPKLDFKQNDFFFTLVAIRNSRIADISSLADVVSVDAIQYSVSSEVVDDKRTNFQIDTPKLIEMSRCKQNGREASINGQPLEGKN